VTPFPVIVGPTAGGKSALALALARAWPEGGEIISADAFQIYRGMDIGTAKPAPAERAQVPHHLIDLVNPGQPFTVADWLPLAEEAIRRIRDRGRLPIVVGGTHLYVKILLEGMFQGPGADPVLRAQLLRLPPAQLRAELERVDPDAARRLHPHDLRRTVRALEVHRLTGRPISAQQSQWDRSTRPDAVLIGLLWPAHALNARINARVRTMMNMGLLEEVRVLRPILKGQAAEALGYKQLLRHLAGECSLEEAVEAIKVETRRFAKNQRTWLRRLRPTPGSLWIDAACTPEAEWVGLVIRHLETRSD
jgi:tRNA dimethylallyltransferase